LLTIEHEGHRGPRIGKSGCEIQHLITGIGFESEQSVVHMREDEVAGRGKRAAGIESLT
jgi:hypothetical protein